MNLQKVIVAPDPAQRYAILAIGGGLVGGSAELAREVHLRCNRCFYRYPMAADPVALALGPEGATILPGYIEVCPQCQYGHAAGDVLDVELG